MDTVNLMKIVSTLHGIVQAFSKQIQKFWGRLHQKCLASRNHWFPTELRESKPKVVKCSKVVEDDKANCKVVGFSDFKV